MVYRVTQALESMYDPFSFSFRGPVQTCMHAHRRGGKGAPDG